MNLSELTWVSVGEDGDFGPSPRGGSRLVVFENHLYLYGGYSLSTDKIDADMEHGKVHDDLWALDLELYKVIGESRTLAYWAHMSFKAIGLDLSFWCIEDNDRIPCALS